MAANVPWYQEITKGIVKENPIFALWLGLCPLLAVTTAVVNGLGMGLAATFVLLCANIIVSAMRKIIPPKVRIPVFIVVIATFVTIVDMSMAAYANDLHQALGIFIPLIVVNCIILGRAEAFASKQSVFRSALDAIGMGIGFTLALVILSAIRELGGAGTVFGYVIYESVPPFLLFILPPGAFITIGLLMGLQNWYRGEAK